MKKSVLLLLSLSLFNSIATNAQQVVGLSIQKPVQENYDHTTSTNLYFPMDLTGFDLDNPLDQKLSVITRFTDDTGKDLLQAHKEVLASKGYDQPMINFYGVQDYENNRDFQVAIELLSSPAKGSKQIQVEGMLYLNFAGSGKDKKKKLKNIPVNQPYDSEGFETPIGLVKMQETGSISTDNAEYILFKIIGIDASINSVEVLDGSALDTYKELQSLGMGIEQNEVAFKGEVPETINLSVSYAKIEKREVPIKLDFSIGY